MLVSATPHASAASAWAATRSPRDRKPASSTPSASRMMVSVASGGGSDTAMVRAMGRSYAQHAKIAAPARHATAANERDARSAVVENESCFMCGAEYCRRACDEAVGSRLQRVHISPGGARAVQIQPTDATWRHVA